jgi:ATP-binding cassette, subfamily B, bacterial
VAAPNIETPEVQERLGSETGPMAKHSGETGSRWRALGALLRPDAGRWVGLGALVAVASALTLAGPLVVRRIVDTAADGTTVSEVTRLAIVFLAIAAFAQLLAVIVAWLATVAAWRTTNDLRLTMTRHVLGLDHEFHRTHTPGELIQRVDGDITSVSEFLGQVVTKAAGAAMLVGGMVIVLSVIDWRLGLGMAVYVVFALLVIISTRHRAISESSDEMGALGRLYGGIEERLTAAEDLRANGAADHVAWRFVEDSEEALVSAVRRERAFLVMWWFVQASVAAGWVFALVIGAVLYDRGVITLGTAFLLFQFVLLVARPLEEVVHELETVQKANGAMVRVAELLAIRPKVLDEGTTSPPAGPLAVAATGVQFDYGDDRPVLRDVDIRIAAGRSVGIVGRTGSGKTTFSRLVLRLVEPTDGLVALNGVPIARSRSPSYDVASRSSPRRSSCSPAPCATTSRCSTRTARTPPSSMRSDASASMHSQKRASIANWAPAGRGCRPARPSCSRWLGCGCETPTCWCSTRRRPASTPRPSVASKQPSSN